MTFPRYLHAFRLLIVAAGLGFGLFVMAGQAQASSSTTIILAQQSTCEGSGCQVPPTDGCSPLTAHVSCNGGYDPCTGGLYDCGGEEQPPYGCDSRTSCGGEENPFAEPGAVLPPDGMPLGLSVQPPEDEDGEAKIVNAPITGSGNSDLIRGGGGSSNR